MKTIPIGLDYLIPVWVAHAAAAGCWAVLAAWGCIIVMWFTEEGKGWVNPLVLSPLAGICLAVIAYSRKVIPTLRSRRLQRCIRGFKALKGKRWEVMLSRLAENAEVQLLGESSAVMANPLTWGGRQRVLTVQEGDVVAEIMESNGRVGGIRLQLIVEEAPARHVFSQRF